MEKSYYEVIKFIDHDNSSRITMDYMQGELLVDKVKDAPDLSKDIIFSWFYNLLIQMIQYHKCCNNRIYRYLNPYSVVITKENEVYLLDIDASSNNFVIKNLQAPSMREHFLKTKIQQTEENKIGYDIYCFGKTLQYVLAFCDEHISMTKGEDNKCFNLIEKCINRDSKKRYTNFIQIKKDLSFANLSKSKLHVSSNKRVKIIIGVILILIVGNIIFGMGLSVAFPRRGVMDNERNNQEVIEEQGMEEDEPEDDERGDEVEDHGDNEEVEGESFERERLLGEDGGQGGQSTEEEGDIKGDENSQNSLDGLLLNLDEDVNQLMAYLHNNNKENNEKIIAYGEEMEVNILRVLAMAYDREGHKEQAILAYGRQIVLENREDHLERAFIRKMKLEEELGWVLQAIETGRYALEIMGGNLDIGNLYLELLITSELFEQAEVRSEYERLIEFVHGLESDGIKGRIEAMEGVERWEEE